MSADLVLVTGASGFVGSHCVKSLQEAGYRVRGTVRDLKNEAKVKFLYDLCPGAAHFLELVEADLTIDESWIPAAKGCKYILHTAGPTHDLKSKKEEDQIKPQVDGTLAVLRAAAEAGSVERVIITSSFAAIEDREKKEGPFSEDDWSVPEKQTVLYNRGKTLAEKAAWDFMKNLSDDKKFSLTVLHPVGIIGPLLSKSPFTVTESFINLMERKFPMIPRLYFQFIDVRDVAEANKRCLTNDGVDGKRIIVHGHYVFYPDIAEWLSEEFKPQGYNIPTSILPNAMLSFASKIDSLLRLVKDTHGAQKEISNERMKSILNMDNLRPIRESTIEMIYTLIEAGLIHKEAKYTGPPSS